MRLFAAIGWLALVTGSALGEEPLYSPDELDGVQAIDQFVGSDEARSVLGRQGFVVTEQQFRQVFEAYLNLDGQIKPLPKFITVDSAWHTYHVLLEEGVRKLEQRRAGVLRRFSAGLLAAASERGPGPGGVYSDLADFAAVGLALQDGRALEKMAPERRAAVRRVLERIRGRTYPQPDVLFFGLPLMPEQFRAVSFYADSPDLQGYFAARQWYATRAFRLESDAETERAVSLALLVEASPELKSLWRELNVPYDRLLGTPDDAGVAEYARLAREVLGETPDPAKMPDVLNAFRRKAAALPDPRVNDQWISLEEYRRRADRTKGFRLLPPRRVPSAVLFHQTTDPAVRKRMVPSGVDLFAAGPLACEAGKRALRAAAPDEATAQAVMAADPGPVPESLHGEALGLLALLQDPLPAAAPAPLRSLAWGDKQLWTALGAWAEQRHTWALQSKLNVSYFGGTEEPPGYVSPYPEFFQGLGKLARRTAKVLRESQVEQEPAPAGRREIGTFGAAPREQAHELLPELADLCDRLAAVARKELGGKPLDEDDVELTRGYGPALARFHFYGGNSYLTPRDDFPLVTPVFSSPVGNLEKILYAGLGRPQAVYVILRVDGKPVLHRGAVLSYREFLRPIDQPLDDDAWTADVRTGRAPPPPAFTASFREEMREQVAARMIRSGTLYTNATTMPGRAITRAIVGRLLDRPGDDSHWLREALCRRATAEDVPDLLRVLNETRPQDMREIVKAIGRVDWTPQRKAIQELLQRGTPQFVDAGAYLLQSRPEEIDVAALAADYKGQRPRSRAIYCRLIGGAQTPGEDGMDLLHRGLSDAEPGVRFHAALAVAELGKATPEIRRKLIEGIDDENQFSAAAMVHALVRLGAKETAPKMLARLRLGFLPRFDRKGSREVEKQRSAVAGADARRGLGLLSVFEMPDFNNPYGEQQVGPLGEELIEALAAFGYEPAREVFRTTIFPGGEQIVPADFAGDALDALLTMNPEGGDDLMRKVLTSDEASGPAIGRALERIGQTGDAARIPEVLPLLADRRDASRSYRRTVSEAAVDTLRELGEAADRDDRAQASAVAAARRALRKRLATDDRDAAHVAYFALTRIDRHFKLPLALEVAQDKKAHVSVRLEAWENIAWTGDARHVPALLPLLDETSAAGDPDDLSVAERAANTIARLLGRDETISPADSPAERVAKLRKIRSAAQEAAAK